MSVITAYANGALAYDSRLPKYAMQSILISEEVNKGGTCTMILFPGHPAYYNFPAFSTLVEIYRDGKLRWRGRPLPLSDAMYGLRTVICEGELCWLNDAIIRPFLYQTDPGSIFIDLIEKYNATVEPWKRFRVGNITVKDANDYIRFESESAMKIHDAVMKLVERCGGYIFFETLPDGTRTINWYAELPYTCRQPITLGTNLLDYLSQANVTRFATRIIPYGAKLEDGSRLQINVDGKDYLQDDEAVDLRGVIEATVTWDDITLEENLIDRAAKWLYEARLLPYSISLSALDLSKMDSCMDHFAVGQRIPAESQPHGLSGYYDLTALQEDLCDPRIGSVTLGRTAATLSGADAAAKKEASEAIQIAMKEIAQQKEEIKDLTATTTTQITSAVQNSQSIIFSALEEYARTSDLESLKETVSAQLEILASEVNISVSQSREEVASVNDTLQAQINEIKANYRFTADGQYIGKTDSDTMMRLVNDMMQILVAGVAATTVDRYGLHAEQANIKTLHMGDYTLSLGTDGHLTLS
jgi:vacuolar-type H+-ATPase subunit E/Vma4